MKGKIFLCELHYLPCLAYFVNVIHHEHFCIEAGEYYVKQTYRNRCKVLTAGGVEDLSIPVHKPTGKQYIKDIKIDYHQRWVGEHWRTIQSAYGKAPFFEYFSDYFHQIYYKKHVFLFDINLEFLNLCFKLLKITSHVSFTEEYGKVTEAGILSINLKDARNTINVNRSFSESIEFTPYTQIFGDSFEANLSIIDLLMCEGPQAHSILKSSIFKEK